MRRSMAMGMRTSGVESRDRNALMRQMSKRDEQWMPGILSKRANW